MDENEINKAQQARNYVPEIEKIVRSNKAPSLMREQLEDYHENDIADALPALTLAQRQKLYRILDPAMLSNILEYAQEDATGYLLEMDARKAAKAIESMESDLALDLLRSLDKNVRATIIDCMDEESQREISLMATFDDDEIGSRMTTNFIVFPDSLSVKQAMSELIKSAPEKDNISTLFVTDSRNCFYGAIDLRELIIAREQTPLEELIVTNYPYVYAREEIDECIERIKDYSEELIPVLDYDNKLIGVITSRSLIQVVDDEMGEDYAKLAGLTAEEDLHEPLVESMKKRLPWLIVLLALGLVVSTVVGAFESVVSQLTLIMAFQSLILDMAGNSGTQSLAVTIRVLMDETLTGRQKLGLVLKEARVGFCDGILLGVVSVFLVGVYIIVFKGKAPIFAFAVSGCIGLSLMVAMLIASLVGTSIPIFFHKLGVDPAVASGPLITTTNDLVAVITYYSLSWVLLINVLHLSS